MSGSDPFSDEDRRRALRKMSLLELRAWEEFYLQFIESGRQLDHIGERLEKTLNTSLPRSPYLPIFQHHLALIHEEMARRQ